MSSIDMLNEGIHIGDVGAVLLLRKTESPRLYYQQIGRCLQVDAAHRPIIFDLVNNCLSIKATHFLEDCEEALINENQIRLKDGLAPLTNNITIHDEVKDIYDVFSQFQDNIMPWNVWFDLLVQYKQDHGHVSPETKETFQGEMLGSWCSEQRSKKNGNRKRREKPLSQDQIDRLEGIGFIWDPLEHAWNRMFDLLVQFKQEYGHVSPKCTELYQGENLGSWCQNQRTAKKEIGKGKISQDQIDKLENIGFIWNRLEHAWNRMFDLLVQYKQEYGHVSPEQRETYQGENLGSWCVTQRTAKNKDTLSQDQIDKLEDIGFILNPYEHAWNRMFDLLVQYKQEHGHVRPEQRETYQGENLGTWCDTERRAKNGKGTKTKRSSTISDDQIERLDSIGFIWDPLEHAWNCMFDLLLLYKQDHGHVSPESRKTYHGENLGSWCDTQRKVKKKDTLSQNKIERLNAIGFIWDALEHAWNCMFDLLVQYKQEHGHVSPTFNETYQGKNLGNWCGTQRKAKKEIGKGKITKDQIDRLADIGFIWNPLEHAWNCMFDLLVQYKQDHGHVSPEQRETYQGKNLGFWCGRQQQAKRGKGAKKITKDKMELLNSIGFRW
jgi:hypothetical protein